MESYGEQLIRALVDLGIIDKEKLTTVFEDCKANDKSIAEYLITHDLISDTDLGKTIAELLQLPFVDLSQVQIPKEATYLLPEEVAKANKLLVFGIEADHIKVAITNPKQDKQVIQYIAQKAQKKAHVYLATLRDFEKALKFYKQDLQASYNEMLQQEVAHLGENGISEAPIIKIVDTLIEYAYDNRASDIHIEPEKNESVVRFRIDGLMHEVLRFNHDIHTQVISRIKFLAKLRTDEHLNAQDGKIQIKVEDEDLDIRVSIVPIVHGEKSVLRLLSSRYTQFGLADLGMSETDLKKVIAASDTPYGMILSTGPTGCGKTTTLYSILKILNTKERNIATIEDPVEYDIEGINQIQVNPKTNLTFPEGLRSILRQDPNVIYVGEIRDDETADIAINSAMTGHLVLSTLHTNDAATTLPRLLDMKVEPFLVASTVSIIIAQRLPRKICEKCRVSSVITREELLKHFPEATVEKYVQQHKELRTYLGKGCNICNHTGYAGRIGIFEVLVISEGMKQLITQKADSADIMKKAREEGMTTMLEDGLAKVQKGITTLDEIIRTVKE